ncbi:MAG: deoxyhypusine synthase family protein [Candidatus Omnitrophica bacterium]|nr:deoxyhypusine synthase family protein [Candidatus Omnitrophota bacterium]
MRDFAQIPRKGMSFSSFYNSLPNILKARELREIAQAITRAHKLKKSVIFMAGAHVIKCGLSPVLIELFRQKVITCLCLNGAGIIHDFEIALQGETSEDVGEALEHGRFGMGRETAEFINQAAASGVARGLGLGEAVASSISAAKLRYKKLSLLFQAYKYKIPVCVFVAIGTDIIHQHPSFDAGMTAEGSRFDFHRLSEETIGLNNGGVVLNFGSAVMLPEVFLKALNLARNLGYKVKNFTTANFDMIYHYRPLQNVVLRPTQRSGKGYYVVGHHEIMLPLLAQAVIEKL